MFKARQWGLGNPSSGPSSVPHSQALNNFLNLPMLQFLCCGAVRALA